MRHGLVCQSVRLFGDAIWDSCESHVAVKLNGSRSTPRKKKPHSHFQRRYRCCNGNSFDTIVFVFSFAFVAARIPFGSNQNRNVCLIIYSPVSMGAAAEGGGGGVILLATFNFLHAPGADNEILIEFCANLFMRTRTSIEV